jgi:hypothetical protein
MVVVFGVKVVVMISDLVKIDGGGSEIFELFGKLRKMGW